MGRGSLWLGLVALVGFYLNPPYVGCFANPYYWLFAAAAGLGVVLGLGGLFRADSDGQNALAIVGIAACVASPWVGGLLQPRGLGPNDSGTLGDIRTFISAQAGYQQASGGSYGTPECLTAPQDCIPAYPTNTPTFLDSQLASLQAKYGYARSFVSRASNSDSPTRIEAYAYTAVPLTPDMGTRGFCGDSSGALCFTPDGSMPLVRDAQCVIVSGSPPLSTLPRARACYHVEPR